MNESDAKLRSLLQLKKLETPGTPYFGAFLEEFHRYQRSAILRRPSLRERVAAWLETLALAPRGLSFSAAGAVACSLLVLGMLSMNALRGPETVVADAPAVHEGYVQVPGQETAPVNAPEELVLTAGSSFDKDFASPRYVTGQALVAYDTSLAF
jgi:hypothetical protein